MGLRLALSEPPDLLVLDLGLPGLDGLALCRQLRQQAECHVPVLMLTARDTLTDKLDGFAAGTDDYLVKPFAPKNWSRGPARCCTARAPGRPIAWP
jgi:DNA-binding response OmpR family regulator